MDQGHFSYQNRFIQSGIFMIYIGGDFLNINLTKETNKRIIGKLLNQFLVSFYYSLRKLSPTLPWFPQFRFFPHRLNLLL